MFSDLRKLFAVIRQEEHRIAGKISPIGEQLEFNEQSDLAEYLCWFAACLSPDKRDKIHIFDFNLSNTLKNTMYTALIQGQCKHQA